MGCVGAWLKKWTNAEVAQSYFMPASANAALFVLYLFKTRVPHPSETSQNNRRRLRGGLEDKGSNSRPQGAHIAITKFESR